MAQFASGRHAKHRNAKALASVYPEPSQRLAKHGAYRPSRYDNMTGKSHSEPRSTDPASYRDTHDRTGFYTPNAFTRYKPAVQRMSARLGSKSRMAARHRWS